MAEPVRARRPTDQEGHRLQQIVRRGSTSTVRYRRATMLPASTGNRVPVIAQRVQADEDTVRDVIPRFNEIGLACLDPPLPGTPPPESSPRPQPRHCAGIHDTDHPPIPGERCRCDHIYRTVLIGSIGRLCR
ncbi:helix-turn-helix domain-containing protein [Streptomyces atratus]